MEFDKRDVQRTLFNMGYKGTDDLWEKLTALPVTVDLRKLEEDPDMKELVILLIIASLEAE